MGRSSIKITKGVKRLLEIAVVIERGRKKRRVTYDEVIKEALLEKYGERIIKIANMTEE